MYKIRYLKDQVIFRVQTKLSIVTLIYNLQCKLVLRGSNEICNLTGMEKWPLILGVKTCETQE